MKFRLTFKFVYYVYYSNVRRLCTSTSRRSCVPCQSISRFRHTSLVPKLVSPRPFDAANDGVIFDIAFQANQPYMLFAYHL